MQSQLRSLPSVERLVQDPRLAELANIYSHSAVVDLTRAQLELVRAEIRTGKLAPDENSLVEAVGLRAADMWPPWPRQVINATGVVIHTNLGRSPLSKPAQDAIAKIGPRYTDLELDIPTGKRGSRNTHISHLFAQITGAESAAIFNNNAAAMMLSLTALASGKEVIVSRSEAVEIGGGFRIPDVLAQSGSTLVEVGTTNRTYSRDYEAAITSNTAAILKVHPSNFQISGFTHEPDLAELVDIGKRQNVLILHDLGSGCLIDTSVYGLSKEPLVQESVATGVDLAMFSGDKLLGGPQSGIVVGKKAYVTSLLKHPLARALRVEKITLAALSATLGSYLKNVAHEEIPIWRMIAATEDGLSVRVHDWLSAIGGTDETVTVRKTLSTIGGGSLPGQTLPTVALALSVGDGSEHLAGRLRNSEPPVIGRIESGSVLLDPRTVLPEEDEQLITAAQSALRDL